EPVRLLRQEAGEALRERAAVPRRSLARAALAAALLSTSGAGATAAETAAAGTGDDEAAAEADEAEVSAPPPRPTPLVMTGYVDVGFAKAQGDGTSFQPNDIGVPADYRVDPFATAVNSRGEVASTDYGNQRIVNGFLPRSVGIGGTPSFLLNT